MTDIVAAAPALQTDDLNRQTTPDTRPHKSAMAGNNNPSANSYFWLLAVVKESETGDESEMIICVILINLIFIYNTTDRQGCWFLLLQIQQKESQ